MDYLTKWGEFMQKVIVIYRVEDYNKWERFYNDSTADRKIHGSREAFIHRNKEAANELVLIYKWDSMENAKKYFESEETKNKMKDAGVIGEPIIVFVEEVERAIA